MKKHIFVALSIALFVLAGCSQTDESGQGYYNTGQAVDMVLASTGTPSGTPGFSASKAHADACAQLARYQGMQDALKAARNPCVTSSPTLSVATVRTTLGTATVPQLQTQLGAIDSELAKLNSFTPTLTTTTAQVMT